MQKRILVLFACLLLAAVGVARADRAERVPLRATFALFPTQIGEWTGVTDSPLTKREIEVLGVDDYLTRVYYTPQRDSVGLYIGFWQSQRQGSTIHSPQNCLPGAGWEPVSQSLIAFPDPRQNGAPPLQANRYVVQKGLDRMLVLYWFQSHGRVIASEYWSKFYLVTDAVRLDRTDGAIVRLTVSIDGQGADAEQRADREALAFAGVLLPKLDAYLPN
ncbi:MAG TPA: EpsI family protein [Vicinamibacterales bacterium]|nr:EpsI family protein [Vicinamibacterales bacterium]